MNESRSGSGSTRSPISCRPLGVEGLLQFLRLLEELVVPLVQFLAVAGQLLVLLHGVLVDVHRIEIGLVELLDALVLGLDVGGHLVVGRLVRVSLLGGPLPLQRHFRKIPLGAAQLHLVGLVLLGEALLELFDPLQFLLDPLAGGLHLVLLLVELVDLLVPVGDLHPEIGVAVPLVGHESAEAA